MRMLFAAERERTDVLLAGYGEIPFKARHDSLPFPFSSLSELCIKGGISEVDGFRLITIAAVISSVLLVIGTICSLKITFFFCPLPFAATYLHLTRKVFRRAESFEKDYTAFLLSLASAVKTGIDPVSALCNSPELFAEGSEVRRQGELFNRNISTGMTEAAAIGCFGSTIAHPDLPLFRSAFLLSRKEGSSLAECLHRLARVTRQRQSFRRKIRAAIAMQKLSAFAIAGCCLAIACIQFCANPDGFLKTLHDPMGAKILSGGLLLIGAGLGWMIKIARTRI